MQQESVSRPYIDGKKLGIYLELMNYACYLVDLFSMVPRHIVIEKAKEWHADLCHCFIGMVISMQIHAFQNTMAYFRYFIKQL